MSLTNEQITAQNFKDFYDRIRPLLNSQHYHVDRSGQELKTLYAGFSTDPADTDDQKYWAGVANTSLPFVKISGDFEMANSIITIPAHTKVKLDVSLSDETATSNTLYAWYDADTNTQLNLKQLLPYATSNRPYSASGTWIWENNTDNEKHITFKLISFISAPKLRYRFCSMTIQEIGRIVDPVQYVANNDELEETPVGNIISYMGNSVPKHYLACNGALYNIGTYSELEAFIIDEFGSVNYFGGDGTTTWAVPDLRGEFLRGTGTNSHTNQGSGANVGIHQDATEMPFMQGSHGNLGGKAKDSNTNHEILSEYNNVDSMLGAPGNLKYASGFTNSASTGTNPDFTARPTNTSVNYCIKYESTYHVIVPSHMYKVSIAGSISTGSGDAQYTFNQSDIIGDASLVSGNSFVAPVDGFYVVGMDVTNKGNTSTYTYIKVNGVDREFVTSSGSTHSLYLNKGDVITIWQHGNTAAHINSGRLSFCLLTANYKDNIIAGGEVYSEEEQIIGTWTDGKPLYQKTIHSTLPSSTGTDKFEDIGATIDTIVDIKAQALRDNNYSYAVNGVCVLGDFSSAVMVNATNNNASSNKNKVGFVVNKTQFVSRPIVVTIQYTKTTDQAGTYQYKNSLLLTRPDMWEPDTEYDFGGGLYGQRFTGTHSTAGSSAKQLLASVSKIVDQGGQIKCPSWVTAPCPFGWGSNFYGMAFIDSSNKLMFNVKTQTTETATYDIWVTYKK